MAIKHKAGKEQIKQMAENNDFYNTYDYGDNLRPADRIKIEHHISFREEQADLSELTALSAERLQAMRADSAAEEQKIFENLRRATKAWETQAAKTMLLDRAIQYVKTPPVKHTSNQWEQDGYGNQSVSNAVYKMSHHIYEETRYDHETKESIPVAWNLTWSVRTNNPDGVSGTRIAGQDRKRFTDKGKMEKYLSGRIKAYSGLFTEILPAVPQEYAKNFFMNGKLLPGYTLAGEKMKPSVRTQLHHAKEQIARENREPQKTAARTHHDLEV